MPTTTSILGLDQIEWPDYGYDGGTGLANLIAAAITKLSNDIVPAGTIVATGRSTADTGWLLCQGQEISRSIAGGGTVDTYKRLWDAIGTNFGTGNGSSTFNIPNLQDRFPIGKGSTYTTLGNSGGSSSITIGTTNLPSHDHSINHDHASTTSGPESAHTHATSTNASQYAITAGGTGRLIDSGPTVCDITLLSSLTTGTGSSHTHSVDLPSFSGTSGSTGSGTAITTISPYRVVNFQIKY